MEKRSSDALTNFGRLEEAATFFLYTAFNHVHMAAQLEVAGMLFAERIETINPEPDWGPRSWRRPPWMTWCAPEERQDVRIVRRLSHQALL
jgi:hypothetical protein